MAVKRIVVECDYCDQEAGPFFDDFELIEDGWFIVSYVSPLGEPVEASYCSPECLVADLS